MHLVAPLAELRRRLLAFLEGRSVAAEESEPDPSSAAPPPPDENPAVPRRVLPAQRWTPERLAVAGSLWGEGFVVPGGKEEVLRWLKPLWLKEESSLLVLGAGAGGGVPEAVQTFGCQVTAYEADPVLVAAATKHIAKAGRAISRRTRVGVWSPQAPAFRKRSFDHALAMEALRGTLERPVAVADLLVALAGAIRPGGALVLVDVVGDNRLDPEDPVVSAWARAECRVRRVPTEEGMVSALGKLKFDVRVAEDITARHIHQVMAGWMALLAALEAQRPGHDRAAAVVAEAEVWLRRLRLMQDGHVKLMRFHAISGY